MRARRVRRIVLLVVAAVVAAVCVRLGFWQLGRLDERRAMNAAIERGLAEPTVEIAQLLGEATDPDDLAYRRVTATGTYETGAELVLYGRALDGSPGDHVLTPLTTADGSVVIVDRGWVPYEPNRTVPVGPPAAAPDGSVSVEGVLVPSEPGRAFSADADPSLVRAVNVAEIDASMEAFDLVPAYLLLQTQDPSQDGGLPVPSEIPELTEGPHLSYAIQWFSFATIAVVGCLVLIRRDRREDRNLDGAPHPEAEEG